MTARIGWGSWTWALGLALLAALLGLIAGVNPGLAVTAALALVFGLVAFSNLTLGLSLYVLASFFALHPYGLYDFLARSVLALAWFALIATRDKGRLGSLSANPATMTALGFFLGWAALSVLWSESSGHAIEAVEQYAASAVLLLIAATAVRDRSDLGLIAAAFVIGTVASACAGIVSPDPSAAEGRLSSPLLDPNLLAAALVAATALCGALFAIYRSPPARVLTLAAAAFCVAGVWLTGSRGGLIAMAVVLLAAIVLASGVRMQVAAVAVTLVGATLIFFGAFAPEQLSERLSEPTRGAERIQEGRTTIWQVAWRAFEEHPVHGLGAGNFRVSSRHYVLQPGVLARTDEVIERPAVVHNAQLEVLTELGLVGWSLFAALILTCLGSMVAAARRFRKLGDGTMQMAVTCVALALIGVLAANFFFSDQYGKPIWILLGLGPAALAMAKTAGSRSARAS